MLTGRPKAERHLFGGDRLLAVTATDQFVIVAPEHGDAIAQQLAFGRQLSAHRNPHVSQGLQQRVVEEEAVAALDAVEVLHFQAGDLTRPGDEIRARLELTELPPQHDAGGLHHVVGVRPVGNQRQDETVNLVLALSEETDERFRRVGGSSFIGSACSASYIYVHPAGRRYWNPPKWRQFATTINGRVRPAR